MILVLCCLGGAYGISLVARDTVSEAAQVPFGLISFALLLFATGAV